VSVAPQRSALRKENFPVRGKPSIANGLDRYLGLLKRKRARIKRGEKRRLKKNLPVP